jgi:hypothetical protein
MSRPTDNLKQVFEAHSELSKDVCAELVSMYDRKLWHELSLKLREVFKDTAYQPYIQDIFNGFIVDFGQKMNLLLFAQFAHDVAKTMDRDAAVALLCKHADSIRSLKGFPVAEPLLFLDMSIAEHYIDMAHMDECKERLDKGLKQLEGMSEARSHPTFGRDCVAEPQRPGSGRVQRLAPSATPATLLTHLVATPRPCAYAHARHAASTPHLPAPRRAGRPCRLGRRAQRRSALREGAPRLLWLLPSRAAVPVLRGSGRGAGGGEDRARARHLARGAAGELDLLVRGAAAAPRGARAARLCCTAPR